MIDETLRGDEGASYERFMGIWSRIAGEKFLTWLAPLRELRWIDIGCGNGAFTQLLVEQCSPAEVQGIDPSQAQLAFARARTTARGVEFRQGDALALPFPDDRFDTAVMALTIFFISNPAKGVAEMARVVRPGGTVAAYAWDMLGGGFPPEPVRLEMRAMGIPLHIPASFRASRIDALQNLWTGAGLDAVETAEITVERTFPDFEDFWTANLLGAGNRSTIATMTLADVELLKTRVQARLPADRAGRILCRARANAVSGRVRASSTAST
jgi:SAM-dependent methyltransferase